jgi:hypothetical protein
MLKIDKIYIGTSEEIISYFNTSFVNKTRRLMKGSSSVALPNMDTLRNTELSLTKQLQKINKLGEVIYWEFENMGLVQREHCNGRTQPFIKLRLKKYIVQLQENMEDESDTYFDNLNYEG